MCKGEPQGYLHTDTEHTSFRLVVEWRWAKGEAARLGKAPNSGVLLRVSGAPKVIPRPHEARLRSGYMVGFTKAQAADNAEGGEIHFRRVELTPLAR